MSNTGLADLHGLAEAEAPDLVSAILAFVRAGEPYDPDRKAGSMDLSGLRAALRQARSARSRNQRRERAKEIWGRYLGQDKVAQVLSVADLVVKLYETPTGPARQALLELVAQAPLTFGLWGGLKRVFKRAERDLDAELIGAFAARFDVETRQSRNWDVSPGTLVYLSRRTARFFRLLGKSLPEQYPSFAVEVLRRYPAGTQVRWMPTAKQILAGRSRKWGYDEENTHGKTFLPPYLSAWKRSPDPMMLLLETCESDAAAQFAIDGLRELFPETLRALTPAWIARVCARPLGAAHDLVVDTLERSPEYHAGRLRELGLHDAVFALLKSPSNRARTYAIAYARGQVASLSTELLVSLLDDNVYLYDVVQFAANLLSSRPPREVGLTMVLRLLRYDASRRWAEAALDKDFDPSEVTPAMVADLLLVDATARFARDWISRRMPKGALSAAFWIELLAREHGSDAPWDVDSHCLEQLAEYPVSSLPADWVLEALSNDDYGDEVSGWLEAADALPIGLDAERIKGLVFDPATRGVAFTLLERTNLIPVADVGAPWLLALARRSDPSLHQWAHQYLVQHVAPEAFGDGDRDAGIARLFALATGKREPDAARAFGQTYLLSHHPRIGRQQQMAVAVGLTPALPREAYTPALVWPALWDDRPDVRRFGVALARVELVRWGEPHRAYELCESEAREVRNVGYDALTQAGKANADPDLALPLDALDAALVFSMTESRFRGTRDVAMGLIRDHYGRIGGAERLGWLMQSADREVRMYAVRILWEKHRPRAVPDGWRVAGQTLDAAQPFDDAEALRDLLRRLLFAVPPARGGEKGDGRRRRMPANAAKRGIVEVVRDLGIRDREFAVLVAPVLAEFTGSIAKGEWQACLAALMAMRSAHPELLADERLVGMQLTIAQEGRA